MGSASTPIRVGFVMLHTSPLDVPGTKDAGGMNVVVRAQAEALARAGHEAIIYTRRSDEEIPARTELQPGLTVVQIDAGPPRLLAKGEHEGVMDEFARGLEAELLGAELGSAELSGVETRGAGLREVGSASAVLAGTGGGGSALADPPAPSVDTLPGRSLPVDILHTEHWFSGISALPVARRLGLPIVHSYHSIAAPEHSPLTDGERPESPGRLAGERSIAHEADLVIAVSEAERATVLDRLEGAVDRVRVVPLGVDTELFHPCDTRDCAEQRDWLLSGGRPEVIVVGRLHPLKGFDLVIEAIATMPPAERPMLRIVGAPPPDGDEYVRSLHDAVARHGMLCTTAFDGALRRGELADRIRRAAVMAVPSYSETFGLVALEAAASGVPVIARDAGGLREAVVDGETGLLLSGDDARVWAEALNELLSDPERLARYGTQARQHALECNWDVSAERLLEVYREVLGG